MTAFFVTGSGTDIGKTFVCAGLLRFWRAQGLQPAAFKPVLSGYDEAEPQGSDPAVLLRALGRPAGVADIRAIAPFRLREPLSPDQAAAREGRRLSAAQIAAACRQAVARAEGPLLIEGAGGAMSPLNPRQTMLDLAVEISAPVLFVAGSYLGALSHALTGLTALQAAGLHVAAVAVNESAEGSVGLDETIASLAGQIAPTPVLGVPRGAADAAWADIAAALASCALRTAARPPGA
jgi:dethiobiotin synthetase